MPTFGATRSSERARRRVTPRTPRMISLYPVGEADGAADPFAAEFLHLDGRRDDGKAKRFGALDDAEHFVSAFFDEANAGGDDFGVVPVSF